MHAFPIHFHRKSWFFHIGDADTTMPNGMKTPTEMKTQSKQTNHERWNEAGTC